MRELVLIDGNSIMNRAFYGIMGSKMLTTPDGKYTNAIYGFLAIMFKVIEDLKPEYMAVAFDLKAPTARHKLYEGYKATRKGMPNELAEQMPIIKNILKEMNITIIEKEGFEADDILGTIAKYGENEGVHVTILSGDRDTFQLATDNVAIRIPHTKAGKTETETFDKKAIIEKYGVTPKQLIEVKGLMGDTSDNIPGVPGVGEKTALDLVKKYETIEELYKKVEDKTDDLKGKMREKIAENKELAFLSKKLGTINTQVPIEEKLEQYKITEWNKEQVLEIFKKLKFNRFIERFNLKNIENNQPLEKLFEIQEVQTPTIIEYAKKQSKIIYMLGKNQSENTENIINKEITSISIYDEGKNVVYYAKTTARDLKEIFEAENIEKYGHNQIEDYVILKQNNMNFKNIKYDLEVAAYLISPTNSKYEISTLANQYLNIDINDYLEKMGIGENKNQQITLFETNEQTDIEKYQNAIKTYLLKKLIDITSEKLREINSWELFNNIEMPLIKVLGDMQYNGIHLDKQELIEFGNKIKQNIEELKNKIYEMCGVEFNINSTQQLGKILFEDLKLTVYKKTKSGYSTDVDVLEKLKGEHPVIEKILEYRTLVKLNSTYVEGLLPYVNEKTKRIHSYFHQTITATGRISSTEPNLQNIPTRIELGKQLRKAFKPENGYVYIDADYSQIELRVLAHISQDENMISAFKNDEDIHRQVASKVFSVPMEEVTKEQRSAAKAVNFGIVYGISDFGLAEQLGIGRKKAKQYIEQYKEKYVGIKNFMENIVEEAKEKGYVETLFHRRRQIPELSSNNHMVRQFGARAAMNTPIQGTAADIMKIAMINLDNRLKATNVDAKLILQVHDELIIECKKEQKEQVKQILQESMEKATKLIIPLKVEISEASNWYEAK